jgi:hypothetical protein
VSIVTDKLKGLRMNIFNLIAHLGLLIHIGKDIQDIIQNLIQHKENFPSNNEFLKLVEDCIILINAGIISLPPDVAQKFILGLNGVKEALSQTLVA